MRQVRVRFRDHVSAAGWRDNDGLPDPDICPAVGFLVYDGPDHIVLAVCESDGQHTGRLQILKACIVGDVEDILSDSG